MTRQNRICSDCPSAVWRNPSSLFTDTSLLSENCDFRSSARYNIVKKVKNPVFKKQVSIVFFKDFSIDDIALNHKNSCILCKEFTSYMATEVLTGLGRVARRNAYSMMGSSLLLVLPNSYLLWLYSFQVTSSKIDSLSTQMHHKVLEFFPW